MVAMGEHQRLRETRMFFQHAREGDFREAVERVTGRNVVAFVSGIDTTADMSCEVFYLEPVTADGPVVAWAVRSADPLVPPNVTVEATSAAQPSAIVIRRSRVGVSQNRK